MTTLTPSPSTELEPRSLLAAFLLCFSNENTRSAYRRDLKQFSGFLEQVGIFDPLDATRLHVDLFARHLEELQLRPASVARKLASLASFYGWCVDSELMERSPVAAVKRPKTGGSQKMGLDPDELRTLLKVAALSGPRDSALVMLLALNGLRISELLGIDVVDLGSERGHRTVRIRRKGGAVAVAPLAPATGHAIDALLASRGAPPTGSVPLFATRTWRRMDRQAADKVLRRLAVGIDKPVSAHTLRHSFVSLSLDGGASLRDVQIACGHADPSTTVLYDRQRKALDSHPTYRLCSEIVG